MKKLKQDNLIEIIKRADEIKKCFSDIDGMPGIRILKGELFEEWIADIKALVLSLRQNDLTREVIELSNSFSGWHDEKNFNKLNAELKAIDKNFDDYYIDKQGSITSYRYEEFCYKLLKSYDLNVTRFTQNKDHSGDFMIETNDEKYYVEVKFYRSSNASSTDIKRAILHMCNSNGNQKKVLNHILIIASEVDNNLRGHIYNEYGVEIIDISNQLYLIQDNDYLSRELRSILNDTFVDLKGIEPKELNRLKSLFKQNEMINQIDCNNYDVENLIERFNTMDPGVDKAISYEALCTEALKYIFDEYLDGWVNQNTTEDGLHRMDLVCRIKRGNEFWDFMKEAFSCRYILFEFKNYGEEIKQTQVYTTEKYLYKTALRTVCFLISRKGASDGANKAISGILRETGKLIVPLSDEDMIALLKIKDNGSLPEDYLSNIIDHFLLQLPK